MRKQDRMMLLICAIAEAILIIETQFLAEMALECLIAWTGVSLVVLIKILWDLKPIAIQVEEIPVQEEVVVYAAPEEDRVCRVVPVSGRFAYDCPL